MSYPTPVNKQVLVRPPKPEEKPRNGIVLLSDYNENPQLIIGELVAAAVDVPTGAGFSKGDTVAFDKALGAGGFCFDWEGERLWLVKADQILCRLEPEKAKRGGR